LLRFVWHQVVEFALASSWQCREPGTAANKNGAPQGGLAAQDSVARGDESGSAVDKQYGTGLIPELPRP
jgi:hypothetical protein